MSRPAVGFHEALFAIRALSRRLLRRNRKAQRLPRISASNSACRGCAQYAHPGETGRATRAGDAAIQSIWARPYFGQGRRWCRAGGNGRDLHGQSRHHGRPRCRAMVRTRPAMVATAIAMIATTAASAATRLTVASETKGTVSNTGTSTGGDAIASRPIKPSAQNANIT